MQPPFLHMHGYCIFFFFVTLGETCRPGSGVAVCYSCNILNPSFSHKWLNHMQHLQPFNKAEIYSLSPLMDSISSQYQSPQEMIILSTGVVFESWFSPYHRVGRLYVRMAPTRPLSLKKSKRLRTLERRCFKPFQTHNMLFECFCTL